jgi:LPS sulfotransferase NodH
MATGIAGHPREWFNPGEVQRQRALWRIAHEADLDPAKYGQAVRQRTRTKNGVAGVKIHAYHLAGLPRLLAGMPELNEASPTQVLARLLPGARPIWLRRRNLAAQAISLSRAFDTGQWWSLGGFETPAPPAAPRFSARRIGELEAALAAGDARWESYFAETGREPLTLYYEDFALDYEGTLRRALAWLGLTAPAQIAPPRLRRQSDAISEEWLARYADDTSARRPFSAAKLEKAEASLCERALRASGRPSALWRQWAAMARMRGQTVAEVAGIMVANALDPELSREAAASPGEPALLAAGQRLAAAVSELEAVSRAASRLGAGKDAGAMRIATSDTTGAVFRWDETPNAPVLLPGFARKWPVLSKWTPDYLASAAGHIPLTRTQGGMGQAAGRHFADVLAGLGARAGGPVLLPSHALLDHPDAAALRADLSPPPDTLPMRERPGGLYLWVGPAGAEGAARRAREDILLVQVFGRRRFRLATPLAAAPSWPQPDSGVHDIALSPGDALFIPAGWWRRSLALDPAASVGFTRLPFPRDSHRRTDDARIFADRYL